MAMAVLYFTNEVRHMNTLTRHEYPLRNQRRAIVSWLLFCIALWATGILVCEKIIEALYFR